MFCKKCGAEIADNAAFCPKCGERVNQVPPAGNPYPNQNPYGLSVPAERRAIVAGILVLDWRNRRYVGRLCLKSFLALSYLR